MMELIDRAATLETLMELTKQVQTEGATIVKALVFAAFKSKSVLPTIPAVPLEPLCEWLAGHYGSPCQLAEIECYPQCEPDENGECYGMRTDDKRCWHDYLTKWMEGQHG